MEGARISRRASLASLGGLTAGALGVAGWRSVDEAGAGPAAVEAGLVACVLYSGTSRQGTENERFLRGVQRTDAKGMAIFRTIYPGWYPGRTVHVHTMVHIGGNVVHTGQLYFPDAVTDAVYRRSPYSQRPARNPRNSADSIYRNGGKRSTLKLVGNRSAYVGSITMGVQRS